MFFMHINTKFRTETLDKHTEYWNKMDYEFCIFGLCVSNVCKGDFENQCHTYYLKSISNIRFIFTSGSKYGTKRITNDYISTKSKNGWQINRNHYV